MVETLENRLAPATLMVNTTADVVNPSNGTLSLRDAISAVNAGNENGLTSGEKNQVSGTFGNNDTIQFSSALSGDAITLTAGGNYLEISKSMTITGLGAGSLAISGNFCRVFMVDSGAQVSITGLTIQSGSVYEHGVTAIGFGAGIYNDGTLTLTNCTISGNSADGPDAMGAGGGGIFNGGTLTVSNCTISGNSTWDDSGLDGEGGGIDNSGTLTVSNSTLSGNSAIFGGGIANSGTLTVSNSTLSGNTAVIGNVDGGGGIYNSGKLTLTNCTLSGNSVTNPGWRGEGGGIFNGGTLTVTNSTLSGNSAGYGGGIANGSNSATLNNTIVANNTSGSDLGQTAAGEISPPSSSSTSGFAGAYDFIGDGSDLSSFTNSLQGNPLLAPLSNYGGPTQTLALLTGSPAINAGNNSLAVDANGKPLTTDQRGKPRIVGSSVDIGAFESQGAPNVAERTMVALGLTQSAEYHTNFITAAYKQYLGRAPDSAGLAYWLNLMQHQGLSDEHLEAGFIGSQEYIANHGGAGQGWITGMYQNLLGRTPAASEVQYWLNQLASGESTADIAYGFAASQERESNRVAADYQQYLGRSASSTEIQYWVNFFENGGSNEQVIAGFIGSQEYFQANSSNTVDWLNAAYLAVLNRQADANGLQYWEIQLGAFS